MPTKTSRTPRKPRFSARTADRHELYQLAVQDPEWELSFVEHVYRKLRRRAPLALREDFCGTALLSATWAAKAGRSAVGIDLDADVLSWGRAHNLAALDPSAAKRVKLLRQDVRKPCRSTFDVTLAYNFSYFVFRTRDDLRAYFESVRKSLSKTGLFFLDAYGGYESYQTLVDKNRVAGFTFLWDQARFDPITSEIVNHIHFEFPDGTRMRRAFTYEWRMWSLPEIRELLAEAGFRRSTVYMEPASGEGMFVPVQNADQDPAWTAYIVAER